MHVIPCTDLLFIMEYTGREKQPHECIPVATSFVNVSGNFLSRTSGSLYLPAPGRNLRG